MLVHCGRINDRDIFYCNIDGDLSTIQAFPTVNWMLFAIADKGQLEILYAFAEKCLDLGVLYVCGVGEAGSKIDDAFSLVEIDRKLANLKRDLTQDDFEGSPMTTWHHDFEEGFWFSATVAHHEHEFINKVVVANLTTNSYETIVKDLICKIDSSWLPKG